MRQFRIYATSPSRFNGGYGEVYVVELNPAEVAVYRGAHGIPMEYIGHNWREYFGRGSWNHPYPVFARVSHIANKKARLVLRYWFIGKCRKKTRAEVLWQADILIHQLRRGIGRAPDYERKEAKLYEHKE